MTIFIDGDQVKKAREVLIWTQEDLAAASGLSSRTVQRIEANNRGSKDSLKALAAAFDKDALEFLQDESHNAHIDRSWIAGPIIGVCGGLFGLAFAWKIVFQSVRAVDMSWAAAMPMLSFLSVMTLFTIGFPAFMICRHWNTPVEAYRNCGVYCVPYKSKP